MNFLMQIDYLILSLTGRCNLACAYCYNGSGRPGTDMKPGVLARAFALAASGSGPLHVQLTGGEPALVPELILQAADLAAGLKRACSLAVQTNATCLTPELADLFRDRFIQVGVSLDGPPGIQEKLRGRAGDTLAGLQLLEAAGVPFRVTAVLTAANTAGLDKLVLLLAGFGQARGIGLDLLVTKGRAAGPDSPRPPDPEKLEHGLRAMAAALEAVNSRRQNPLRLREQDMAIAALTGFKRKDFCLAAAGRSLAVAPDGRLFACSQTMGDERFGAGTVWEPQPERPGRLRGLALENSSCGNCPFEENCPGDCPSRLLYNRRRDRLLACTLYRALLPADRPGKASKIHNRGETK